MAINRDDLLRQVADLRRAQREEQDKLSRAPSLPPAALARQIEVLSTGDRPAIAQLLKSAALDPSLLALVIPLLDDPERHRAMAAAARQTALTRFCATKIVPQYEQYYREVCRGTASE